MATSDVLAIVRAKYPAYDGVADATVEVLIDLASLEIAGAATTWRELYPQAVAALTAHELEMRARSAAGRGDPSGGGSGASILGPTTSIKTDKLSVSYGDGAALVGSDQYMGPSDKIYASTIGGQEYLRLRGRLANLIPLSFTV